MRFVFAAAALLATSPIVAKVERIEWTDRMAWSCASVIAVQPFAVRPSNDQRVAAAESMEYFSAELAGRLIGRDGINRLFLTREGQNDVDADIIITGTFLELGVNRQGGRITIGSPSAKCRVNLRAFRRGMTSPVFEITHGRETPVMSNDDNGLSSIEAVAADITRELLRNRGKCQALPAPPAAPRPAAPAPVPPPIPAPPAAVPTAASAIDTATVAIESNVADADVSVDGKFAGNAPIASLALSSGSHTIAVSAAGYGTWQRELTVTAGSTTRVKATLQLK